MMSTSGPVCPMSPDHQNELNSGAIAGHTSPASTVEKQPSLPSPSLQAREKELIDKEFHSSVESTESSYKGRLRVKKRKNYALPKINCKNTIYVPSLPAKPKKRKIDPSETEAYRIAQAEIRERKKRINLIHNIKKLHRSAASSPLLPTPLGSSGAHGLFSRSRTRSGSGDSQNSSCEALTHLKLNSLSSSPEMIKGKKCPLNPPVNIKLENESYSQHRQSGAKKLQEFVQKTIQNDTAMNILNQQQRPFDTTLNINWGEVQQMKEKNSALIQSFLKRRAKRELLRSWGVRQDKRRTAASIPLDSVKAVPGATYFKTEGKELKIDLSRGVKWSNKKQAFCAKTMFAGKKYTLGYFRDEELANQAYLFAVEAKRQGTIKEHLVRIGAHPPPELMLPGKRKRGRPRKYPRPEDLKKQKQLLPRYGTQGHIKLNSMSTQDLFRMVNEANQRAGLHGKYAQGLLNIDKSKGPRADEVLRSMRRGLDRNGVKIEPKPRSGSWPFSEGVNMGGLNEIIQQTIQRQVAAQLSAMKPMLSQNVSLSLNSTEINLYSPGTTPKQPVKLENLNSVPELSPGPENAEKAPVPEAHVQPVTVQKPLAPAAASMISDILGSSPTLAPTSFFLPVNMEEDSDSDDEMFPAPSN